MKSDLFTIIKKEFARFFGDKRMLLTALTPGLLIYVLYSIMGSGMSELYMPEEDYVYEIQVVNLPQSLSNLKDMETIIIDEIEETQIKEIKLAIQEEEAELLAVFPENFDSEFLSYDVMTSTEPAPNVELYYNSASTMSGNAYHIMMQILEQLEQSVANRFDVCRGEETYDLASEEDMSAMLISMIMPMLVIMMLFNGCLAAAAESIAGEKERGTIATLLVTPMKRRDLALGKMISLSGIGLLSGISSFLGIMLSLPNLMKGSGLEHMKFGYTGMDYLVLFFLIIVTTFFIVGMISIISAFAKSVKEATSMATPLMLLVTLVGLSNMISGGMPQEWYWYLIPVYNTVQCMAGVFSMDYSILPVLITTIVNLCYSGILAAVLTKMFDSERMMYT